MAVPTSTLFDDLLDLDLEMDVDLDAPDDRTEAAARTTSWVWELREIVAGAVVTALVVCFAFVELLATAPAAVPGRTGLPAVGHARSVPGADLPGIATVLAFGR